MVRIDRSKLVARIESKVSADSPPEKIVSLISGLLSEQYSMSVAEAAERAESVLQDVKELIRDNELSANNEYFGYFYPIRLSKINDDYVHGACFILSGDDDATKISKRSRAKYAKVAGYIDQLDADEFEVFCGNVLSLLGVRDPIVTPHGGDQGIDFLGRWHLQDYIQDVAFPDGLERQFTAWIIGQAKKYVSTKLNTDVVRELVGSVQLAKSKVFSKEVDEYRSLDIAYCDPIFYVLITTGAITSGVATLLQGAGMLFFDRDLLSVFIADRNSGQLFDPDDETSFRKWALT